MTDETPMTEEPTMTPPTDRSRRGVGVDRKTLESLVCPLTQKPLDFDREAQELISRAAGLAFPIRDGIPIMLVDEARHID